MSEEKPKVVIVGGGFGGFTIAQKLDKDFDVTILERRKEFFYNIAALRAVVDESIIEKIFFPYDKLLRYGKVLQAVVTEISSEKVTFRETSGEEQTLSFDYLVIATGSSYPFPFKTSDAADTENKERMHEIAQQVKQANRILIAGGGAVGVELAGEIASAFPQKKVILVHSGDVLVDSKLSAKFKARTLQMMKELGIEVLLNEKLELEETENQPGYQNGTAQYHTVSGKQIEADMFFSCRGTQINNAPLKQHFEAQLDSNGHLKVNQYLQVEGGQPNIFAIGDITNVPEMKLGYLAGVHASVVDANIRSLRKNMPSKMKVHVPAAPMLLLATGRDRGLGQIQHEIILGNFISRNIKSKNLFISRYQSIFNYK